MLRAEVAQHECNDDAEKNNTHFSTTSHTHGATPMASDHTDQHEIATSILHTPG